MRALALHPSEADIKRLLDEVAPSGKVDFICAFVGARDRVCGAPLYPALPSSAPLSS
jgi:hypothetical protein